MSDEIINRALNVLLEISSNLEPVYFWYNYAFWLGFINLIVLAVTLFFLIRYTRATEKIVDYQMSPAVDVNMIFDSVSKKTYFWFSNASSIPGFVSIKVIINNGEKEVIINPLRISPGNIPFYKKTANHYDFLHGISSAEIEILLDITITSALKNNYTKHNFTKSYRFDKSKSQWNETSWAFPDPPFPIS
jgi:hypothetical protein